MNNNVNDEIQKLKKERNAVILAHYYVPDDVQKIADYVGDSFYLAKVAKSCEADVIVFCGVSFMGESAKILNPGKTVLMPDLKADCPMAHMVTPGKIEKLREQYPDLAVVCYINSTARLKCLSDVCVTSSNALEIVRKLPNQNIFFIPDENLGRFVAQQIPEKNIILNDGCCHVHADISIEAVLSQKALHPEALVVAHPECREDIVSIADYVGSTSEIIEYAGDSICNEFIVCTEEGVGYELKKNNPGKKFYFKQNRICCADMKLNTPEKVLNVLKSGENRVEVDCEIARRALLPLDKMLKLAR